jgi:ribosomal 50S subunit-recycling heat shock protein
MRLDKFLKLSRAIKRRAWAKEACENGIVTINGRIAKPHSELKTGDIIEINIDERRKIKVEVVNISESGKLKPEDFRLERYGY